MTNHSGRMPGLALRGVLLMGIAAPALLAAPARAEEMAAAQASGEAEILVVGSRPIAESESAALEIQRNSDALVSVLAADSIGRLPDQNLAQAISRLPGVGIQRDQGQARFVNLRGAPLNWTTISFDGIFIVSPEGRSARFDSIPSALASQVVVQKAVTPDLNGETISGNINVVTRSPFDYKGMHFQTKLGIGKVDLGNGTDYEGSVVASNRWETGIGEVGVLVSGSYYQRYLNTDNFEIDWEEVSQDNRPLAAGESEKRVWGREIENKFYRITRKNYSVSGRLEWRPDSANKFSLTSIYTAFTDDEFRDNYRIDADDQQGRVPTSSTACGTVNAAPAPFTTGYADICTGNTPLKGTLYGVDYDARFRKVDYLQSVFTNTLAGDHELSEAVTLAWRGNYTRSVNDRSVPYLLTYQQPGFGTNGTGAVNRVTADYDFTDPFNSQVRLYRTLRDANGVLSRGAPVANYRDFPNTISSAVDLQARDVTNAYTGKMELNIKTSLFGDTTFRFGGQYDQRTKARNESELALSGGALTTALTNAGIGTSTSAIIGIDPYKGKFKPGYEITPYADALAEKVIQTARNGGAFVPNLQNYYRVREAIWSGFAMGTTRFDWGNIVYGARIEHITNTGTAFNQIPGIAGFTPVTVESSRTLIYPSAHVNWNAREDMKVRLSFNTGAARPDYSDLAPIFNINDSNEIISGGNPFAEPERAKGVDLYWEWYIQPQGFVSLGVFYKDVSKVLFDNTTVFGSNALDTGGINRSQYDFSTLVNGGKGEIYGFEGAFQMQLDPFLKQDSWIGGFGIQANITYNQSEAITPDGRKVSLPGTSRWIYNVGPYYEKYGVSARLSYQKRTAWFSELGDESTGGDLYWDTDEELDASARLAITPNFEVYVEGSNLLNGPGRRYAGNRARTLEFEKFGRRYQVGVRATF
jgi:TonB-dependent receptor